MKDVFISYHMRSSQECVKQISIALEGAGISCWYAPRDVDGDYATSIVKAIRECKVFLLILNKDSNVSEDVRNEINVAFERFRKHENITLLPFQIDECDLSDAVLYYIGRIHIMDGGIPPAMLRLKELICRVSSILGKETERVSYITDYKTESPAQYRLVGSMIYADSSFVGRKKELETIHHQLSSGKNKLFLVGMGGIGKSEISKAYCENYRNDYDVIIWVSFQDTIQKTLSNDFEFPIEGIERTDYPEEDDKSYFMRKLNVLKRIADSRVLIVLDNFDVTEDEDLSLFCSGSYSVLFTTRYHSLCANWPNLLVSEITEQEELLAIFQTEYKRNIDISLDTVRELLQLLNGHPLSIRLVASAMQSRRISPEKMLEILKQGASALKTQNAKASDIISGRLRQVFSIAGLTFEEQHLLKNLALLPLQGITVETLYEWCDFDDFDVIDGLIAKSWIIHAPGSDEVHLHPLIADLMIEQLEKDFDCCNQLLMTLKEKQENWFHRKASERRQIAACFASVWQRLPKTHPKKWDVMWGRAKMVFETSLYEQGLKLFEELLEQTADMEQRLMVYNRISQGYCLSGNPEKSIEVAVACLDEIDAIPKEILSKNIPVWKKELYIRIAQSNQHMGNYDIAEKYARMALEGEVKFHHSSPLNSYGWTEIHLAKILFLRNGEGDLAESEACYEHAITLFEQENDILSPAYCYNTLGQIYMLQGKFEEAFNENHKCGEILFRHLGKVHVDIAVYYALEGNIYRAMGKEPEALKCYAQAKEVLLAVKHKKYERLLDEIIKSGKIGYLD